MAGYAPSLINFRGPLLRALVEAGLEVHAVAPGLATDTGVRESLESWGVASHDVAFRRTGTNPLHDLQTLGAMYRLLRHLRPDAVLGYTIKPVVYGTLAAWLAGVPRRFALITGLGYAFTGEAAGRRGLTRRLVRRLYRQALRRASWVCFQNPDDRALFLSLGLLDARVPSEVVNGSGVDTVRHVPSPLPLDPPVFLLIARLLGDKGVREYVAAAHRVRHCYPQAIFRLVGDLDDNPDSVSRAELEAWVASGDVEYLGYLDDVRPAIAAASVYVLPSYREGTPRTVLEAMAMGRPVITTDAPGCRETVVEGDNGYLVPVKSVDALAEAMRRFLEDPGLIETMGRRGRRLAESKYDVQRVNATMMAGMGIAPACPSLEAEASA